MHNVQFILQNEKEENFKMVMSTLLTWVPFSHIRHSADMLMQSIPFQVDWNVFS